MFIKLWTVAFLIKFRPFVHNGRIIVSDKIAQIDPANPATSDFTATTPAL
jgi:hypothetical protein